MEWSGVGWSRAERSGAECSGMELNVMKIFVSITVCLCVFMCCIWVTLISMRMAVPLMLILRRLWQYFRGIRRRMLEAACDWRRDLPISGNRVIKTSSLTPKTYSFARSQKIPLLYHLILGILRKVWTQIIRRQSERVLEFWKSTFDDIDVMYWELWVFCVIFLVEPVFGR